MISRIHHETWRSASGNVSAAEFIGSEDFENSFGKAVS